jgi:hypothetical protein
VEKAAVALRRKRTRKPLRKRLRKNRTSENPDFPDKQL